MTEQRRVLDRRDQSQAEFVDTLQVTSTEQEARADPATPAPVPAREQRRDPPAQQQRQPAAGGHSSPGGERDRDPVGGAEPRSCLAVRFGRPHREGPTIDPLLACSLCTGRDLTSVCEPLLVGGEVIGSVLVEHAEPLHEDQHRRIETSVTQAAPVLANLRTLALAEFRADNDSLTGLPNKRAPTDTLKRMVAQASRSITPLAAIMLDLDHFKQINDKFGHGGRRGPRRRRRRAAQRLRASDFAGRFGGEEFLVLLPDTGVEGAVQVAEKMRPTVGLHQRRRSRPGHLREPRGRRPPRARR